MSNTPTPETDEIVRHHAEAGTDWMLTSAALAGHARLLEMRLNEALATIECLRNQLCADKCRDKAAADGNWASF